MKIHLTRTPEYPIEHFQEVVELLQAFGGELEFVAKEQIKYKSSDENIPEFVPDDILKKVAYDYIHDISSSASWNNLFRICQNYRAYCNISSDDFVVLLTPKRNEHNWFGGIEQKAKNIFIHTSDWELFIKSHHKYPVAYLIVAYVIRFLMKFDTKDFENSWHKFPLGCINDFCQNKKEIILKLRTGDICGDCLEKMQKENVNTAIISQALTIFEGIRKQMLFKQGFQQNIKISRLLITPDYRIFLPDFGNIEIKLSVLQKIVYFLYLKYQNGISFPEFADYKSELWEMYQTISPQENLDKMKKSVDSLCDRFDNSLSGKISKIRLEFQNKIGNINPKLLDSYCIIGENGEKKKISLDRQLVTLPF